MDAWRDSVFLSLSLQQSSAAQPVRICMTMKRSAYEDVLIDVCLHWSEQYCVFTAYVIRHAHKYRANCKQHTHTTCSSIRDAVSAIFFRISDHVSQRQLIPYELHRERMTIRHTIARVSQSLQCQSKCGLTFIVVTAGYTCVRHCAFLLRLRETYCYFELIFWLNFIRVCVVKKMHLTFHQLTCF